jgi:hypothetical protein
MIYICTFAVWKLTLLDHWMDASRSVKCQKTLRWFCIVVVTDFWLYSSTNSLLYHSRRRRSYGLKLMIIYQFVSFFFFSKDKLKLMMEIPELYGRKFYYFILTPSKINSDIEKHIVWFRDVSFVMAKRLRRFCIFLFISLSMTANSWPE